MRRRDFLNIVPAAMGIPVGSIQENSGSNNAVSLLETIASRMKISGWSIDIPEQPVRQFLQTNSGSVTIKLDDAPTLQLDNYRGTVSPLIRKVESDGENYWRFRGLPNIVTSALVFIVEHEEHTLASRVFPIRFPYVTCDDSDDKKSNPNVKLYSEVQIPRDKLEQLHTTHSAFEPFLRSPTDIYLESIDFKGKRKSYRYARFVPEKNIVVAPVDFFTNPYFPDEGVIVLTHELGHAIIHMLQHKEEYSDELAMIINTYDALIRDVHKERGVPKDPHISLELYRTPQVQIFDESSYNSTNKEIDYGDPHKDYNELFGSALTILRNRPEQFVARYESLSLRQKAQARTVVGNIFKILSGISIKRENIVGLIPRYDFVVQNLQLQYYAKN